MLPGEDAATFLRRVFVEVIADQSPSSFDLVKQCFHPDYKQHVDDKVLDREAFIGLMRVQKTQILTPPRFTWKKLVATEPRNGRIHVTSVHNVSLRLRGGSVAHQKVVALIEIDVASGTIIQCDELTRMDSKPALEMQQRMPPFEAGFIAPQISCGIARRPAGDRPPAVAPAAKLARSAPPAALLPMPPKPSQSTSTEPIALRRTGVSELLGDMCENFGAAGDEDGSGFDSSLETEADTDTGEICSA